MQPKSEIRNFIMENFLYGQDNGLGDDVSFLQKGLMDSTGILELVSFIEEKYGISIDDEELIPDNFDSLNKLSAFITSKTANSQIETRNS